MLSRFVCSWQQQDVSQLSWLLCVQHMKKGHAKVTIGHTEGKDGLCGNGPCVGADGLLGPPKMTSVGCNRLAVAWGRDLGPRDWAQMSLKNGF